MRLLLPLLTALLLTACGGELEAPPAPAEAAPAATPADPVPADALTVLYLGDSLTAGYGLPSGTEGAYPALLQARFDSLGVPVRTVNAGVSGDTSAGGLSRIGWYLDQHRVDVLVLALGANDGLRGLSPRALRQNLTALIERARAANPDVRIVLAGMMIPTNMGGAYGREFSAVYPAIAEAKGVTLIPFLLDGVGGVPAMNQPDGVHPTAAGQRVMAETVWAALRPVVEEARAARAG